MAKEAIIIGAGPAGTVAAILLARGGWRVTLIEQHRFPRDKVCGECLSALGVDVLKRLRLSHPAAIELTRAELHSPSGESLSIALPRPMWGLSRKVLDAWLLDEARRAEAVLLQPARCERILPPLPKEEEPGARPRVVVRDLVNNQVHELTADCVLLADGKAALLPHPPSMTSDLGIKSHWSNLDAPRDTIELFGFNGHYGGLAAIEDRKWNLACSVPAARVREVDGDFDVLLARMSSENPTFRRRMHGATRIGPWLASPLPRFGVAGEWPSGIIPLGNAAAAIEPIGGEGMGLAMRSAELAADFLLNDGGDLDSLRAVFHSLWCTRRPACRFAGAVLSRPVLANQLISFATASDSLLRPAMRFIGKM